MKIGTNSTFNKVTVYMKESNLTFMHTMVGINSLYNKQILKFIKKRAMYRDQSENISFKDKHNLIMTSSRGHYQTEVILSNKWLSL